MRGAPAITNGEITQPLRSEADARADRRRQVFEAAYCTGTPPVWPYRNLWNEAKERARIAMEADEQHDAHVTEREGHFYMLWRQRLDEQQAQRERYA